MFQRKKMHLLYLLALLTFSAVAGNWPTTGSGNDSVKISITQDETILFNMINDMRRQHNLPSIPLSLNLCKVAQTHIDDLIKWKPQEKGCSLHSWSGSGKWTSCCNTREVFGIQCMKAKPREITGYQGDGYELIYWGEGNVIPSEAADLWKQVEASSEMILSRAIWSGYQWKAIGVGVKGGYAVLWLGDASEKNTENKTDEKISAVQQPVAKTATVVKQAAKDNTKTKPVVKQEEVAGTEKSNQPVLSGTGTMYFLIVSSVKTEEAAETELKKVKSKGYPNAHIVQGESVFRIAIASFDTAQDATAKKNTLKESFPGIWVLKK